MIQEKASPCGVTAAAQNMDVRTGLVGDAQLEAQVYLLSVVTLPRAWSHPGNTPFPCVEVPTQGTLFPFYWYVPSCNLGIRKKKPPQKLGGSLVSVMCSYPREVWKWSLGVGVSCLWEGLSSGWPLIGEHLNSSVACATQHEMCWVGHLLYWFQLPLGKGVRKGRGLLTFYVALAFYKAFLPPG